MSTRLTTSDFIKRARKIHGSTYSYSKVNYKNTFTKIKIICSEHGTFEQKPNHHLNGHGCPECGRHKKFKLGGKVIKKRLEEIHEDKWDYTKINFENIKTEDILEIICPIHGSFFQNINDHMYSKSGCPECKRNTLKEINTKSKLDFVKDACKIHKDKYNYEKVIYKNAHQKVKIICPDHGVFEQSPMGHLFGYGCQRCAGKNILNKKDFIEAAKDIHGKRFDYSSVDYQGLQTQVEIICPIHGSFFQTPNNHIHSKSGCPKCAKYGFKLDEPAILYYFRDIETDLYKIGITNNSLEDRYNKTICSNRAIALFEQSFKNGKEALIKEQKLLEEFKEFRTTNESWPKELGGRTEFFTKDILKKENYD